jgi:ABC-type lipoprotein release transport system permease subunit
MKERSFWLRVGWRNLGRHRRRSVITALALAWGFAAVVVLNGIMDGMGTDFIRSGTDLMAGQIRIQNPAYEPPRSWGSSRIPNACSTGTVRFEVPGDGRDARACVDAAVAIDGID